jgi:hypothetical protein
MDTEQIAVQVLCETPEETEMAANKMALLHASIRDNNIAAVGCTDAAGNPALVLCVLSSDAGQYVGYTPIGLLFDDLENIFDIYTPPARAMNPEDLADVAKH